MNQLVKFIWPLSMRLAWIFALPLLLVGVATVMAETGHLAPRYLLEGDNPLHHHRG